MFNTSSEQKKTWRGLSRHDILEYIRQQRPDTKWVVHLLTNVTFYLNKLIQHPIGTRVVLPDFFLRNQGLVCFVGGAHGPYKDNLCFFSRTPGAPDVKALEVPANTYYHQYLQYRQMASKDFQGVCLDDLMVVEQLFSLNVYVYDLQEMEEGDIAARLV
jgi:hypothetical protein